MAKEGCQFEAGLFEIAGHLPHRIRARRHAVVDDVVVLLGLRRVLLGKGPGGKVPIEDSHHPAGSHHPRGLLDNAQRVADVADERMQDDGVELAILQPQAAGIAGLEGSAAGEPFLSRQSFRSLHQIWT
jgi:hypothetical protein